MTTKRTKRQRALDRAVDMLRRPGARIVKMHRNRHDGTLGIEFFIVPGGPLEDEIAAEIINRPDVHGCADGLFPGCEQTWRFA